MQRYQTEDEHRKAMRAKINKTIKRGRRRKRIIRRLNKAVPGICIGVLIAGMGAWCIAAPLPDPDDYEPYRFQAENGTVSVLPETTLEYDLIIAAGALKMPIEFFKQLKPKDALALKNRVTSFLFGEE